MPINVVNASSSVNPRGRTSERGDNPAPTAEVTRDAGHRARRDRLRASWSSTSSFVLGIGFALQARHTKTSADFFLSGRSIPAWIAGLAFLSANLGAQEVIGMAASGAKYGIATSHFYWVGAIPAMVFVGVFMMPFYYGSRARSVPEYLKLRFDEKTRGFNAISFAAMTVFSSGISMYALAPLLDAAARLGLQRQHRASRPCIVLVYIFLGGLTSAIYNEVLQFFLIVLGFAPLVFLGLRDVGGWDGLTTRLARWRRRSGYRARAPGRDSWAPPGRARRPTRWASSGSAWRWASASCSRSATGAPTSSSCSARWRRRLDVGGAAHAAHRRVPEDAVPVPRHPARHDRDRAARTRRRRAPASRCRAKADGTLDYDMAIPLMLAHYFPPGLLGLGLTALHGVASCRAWPATSPRSTRCGPTTSTRATSARTRSDAHYLWMGRMATVVGIALSVATAYSGDAVQQHHGHAAAGVRVRERAAVRDVPARHVLEARDRPRRLLRAAAGHAGRGAAPRPDAAGRARSPGSRAAGSARCTPTRARWRRTSGPRSGPGRPASWSTIVDLAR